MNSHIALLSRKQAPDGSFVDEGEQETFATTTRVLSVLGLYSNHNDGVGLICQKAAAYILSHIDFSSKVAKRVAHTFYGLKAVAECDTDLLNGEQLAKAVSFLTSIEKTEGGPYVTYDAGGKPLKLSHPDSVVANVAIADFLAALDVQLDNLDQFLNQNTQTQEVKPLPKSPHHHDDPTALAELIANTLQTESSTQEDTFSHKLDPQAKSCLRRIVLAVHETMDIFEKPLAEKLKLLFAKMQGADTYHEIPMLPFYFARAMRLEPPPLKLVAQLGIANTSGWLAYTIYDDFLDDEGRSDLLPAANVFVRSVSDTYLSNSPSPHFTTFFHHIMNGIDVANAWEVTRCRWDRNNSSQTIMALPDYDDFSMIANKSLGHALGPLLLLAQRGYAPSSQESQAMLKFFRHYLIARQLNDDAHDWESDLLKGHVSPVCVLLLEDGAAKDVRSVKKAQSSLNALRDIFWQKTILTVCDMIRDHAQAARTALQQCKPVTDPEPLENILIPLEKTVQKTLDERQRAREFVREYGRKS